MTYHIPTVLPLWGGVLEPFPCTTPGLPYKCSYSPDGKTSTIPGKCSLPHRDEFEPETCGEMGLLPEGLDRPAICRVYPVMWFQFCKAKPHVSARAWRGSHPAHVTCYSQLLQHPVCISLPDSAFTVLDGLVTTSPLCQTCRLVGV